MDNMLEHPGIKLQVIIKEKGLTQKAFASILGKKVSEVNELLKGKRNITIQRDYLLHQTLGTPIKYWILKQVDYDYSLIDIEDNSPLLLREGQGEVSENTESSGAIAKDLRGDTSKSSTQDFSSQVDTTSGAPQNDNDSPSSGATLEDLEGKTNEQDTQDSQQNADEDSPLLIGEGQGEVEPQKTPIQEPKKEIDEDFRKRARIFKSF